MSVLIKGMKMPKSCGLCRFDDYGYCTMAKQYSGGSAMHGIASFCPLVEVPEPHGDLIDRDWLMTESQKDGAYGYVDSKQIYDAPTAIEAEGE